MRTSVKIAFALVAAGSAAVLVWSGRPAPDPHYGGKSLSTWLGEYGKQSVSFYDTSPPQGEAVDAIRAIGTNGIPLLLSLTEARGFSMGWQVKKMIGGHFHWMDNPKNFSHHLAWCGFQALGSSAQPAVPALTKLAEDSHPETRRAAVVCLGYIGPAPNVVPALIRRVEADGNTQVRSCAILSLGKVHSEPELVVPVLLKILQTPSAYDNFTRNQLIVASLSVLTNFGQHATAALPQVRVLTGERDWNIHWWATTVLQTLAPEAAIRPDAGQGSR